jgi:hypothetical protein
VAAVLAPMPFVLYFTGKKIRRKSTFAPAPDIEQDNRKRDEESNGADEKQQQLEELRKSGEYQWRGSGEGREGDRLVSWGLCEALRASGRRLGVDLVLFRSTIPRVLLHLRRLILCESIPKVLVVANTQCVGASILRFKMGCDSGMHWSTTPQVSFAAFAALAFTSVRDRTLVDTFPVLQRTLLTHPNGRTQECFTMLIRRERLEFVVQILLSLRIPAFLVRVLR